MKNKLFVFVCSLFLMIGVFIGAMDMSNSLINEPIQYRDTSTMVSENKKLLEKVKKLEELAISFKKENNLEINSVELCLQFLRKDRYNDEKWRGLIGPVDGTFVEYVNANGDGLEFSNFEIMYDVETGRVVDFIHFIATLNGYVRYDNEISLVITRLSTDYAGIAGDLLTFLEEATNYRINNNMDDVGKYQVYIDSLLGTNQESTLSTTDMLADIDAYNIYHDEDCKVKTNLYDALVSYYDTYDSKNNVKNRMEVFKGYMGDSEENITNKVNEYFSNLVIRKLFIPDTSDKVTEWDIQVVAKSFYKYLEQNVYLELETHEGETIVGKDIEVKIIENHLNNAVIKVDPKELALAKINGEYLVITPKESGQVKVTVSDANGTVSDYFVAKIKNIEPKIEEGLDANYYLNLNGSKTLYIKASGTNNIYTWYISDSKEGEYTVLSETTNPNFVLTPTLDMNGKYIKCGVRNNGNEEVYSNITLIFVDGENKVVKESGNNVFIIVLIVIIVLGIIAILVYYLFFREKNTYIQDREVVLKFGKNLNIVDELNRPHQGDDNKFF